MPWTDLESYFIWSQIKSIQCNSPYFSKDSDVLRNVVRDFERDKERLLSPTVVSCPLLLTFTSSFPTLDDYDYNSIARNSYRPLDG